MLKKIIFILLLISHVTFAEYQAKVNANVLNVRATGSASSKVISKLNKGDEITLYSCKNGFCEISLGKKRGFVSEKFISVVEHLNSKEPSKTNKKGVDYKWWLLVVGIGVVLYLLAFFAFSKAAVGLLKFSAMAFLAYCLWGLIVYGIGFLWIIVLGFIAALILFAMIKFMGLVFGEQTASESTDEDRKRWREERERKREEREYEKRNRMQEERNRIEQEKQLSKLEQKARREQELKARQKRLISDAYISGGYATCHLMDGNGAAVTAGIISSVPADSIVGYTSTTLSVKKGCYQVTYRLNGYSLVEVSRRHL